MAKLKKYMDQINITTIRFKLWWVLYYKIKKLIKKLIRILFIWDWLDFGIMLRIYKTSELSDYILCIDIQILWLNIWMQCFKRKEKNITQKLKKMFNKLVRDVLIIVIIVIIIVMIAGFLSGRYYNS